MSINGKEMPLVTNNATYKVVNGVTYFKLKSEFPGDYTKNCGLLGEEIDENFYFLRGYDIESIEVDKERNLIINRVDKDYAPLIVNIGEKLGQPTFKFDKDNGVILVSYPDGTTATMDGFLVEGKDIRIATDSTLGGNGTIYNPLRLAEVERTGTFSPAVEYFDLTNGERMPDGKGKGYRIVTKEKIDNFGCLYPFSAVKRIQEKLEETGSQWRVPTKKDWDELLNALETNPENRVHTSNKCEWTGELAGAGLKSATMWMEHNTLPTEVPTNGQDKVGLTIYPVGITPDRNEILNGENNDAEGFTQIAGMWTNTTNDEGNAFVKIFGYNSAKVDQDTYGNGARMSIRLCKDYTYSNFNEIETILGFPYPTELVYSPCDDVNYVKIWTKINFYSDAENLDGIRSEEWSATTESDRGVKIVYFINEWDGSEWHKKPMNDGDSIVIINYNNEAPYHEWRIVNGELIDTVAAIMNEFSDELNDLNTRIETEIQDRKNSDTKLQEAISSEGELRKKVDDEILASLQDEVNIRKSVDDQLFKAVKSEGEIRKSVDDQLLETIKKESTIRETADNSLNEAIIKEGEIRKSVDDQLFQAVKSEGEIRKSVDDQLLNAIRNEGIIRKNNDITPGEYVLYSNETMTLPTNGADILDVKINVSDDFFNFGTF